MITLDVIRRTTAKPDAVEFERWIEDGWVRPQGDRGAISGDAFQDIDVARIHLIRELQRLDIGDEAMPVVLGLLDQIYGLRRRMRLVRDALLAQSPEMRRSIFIKIEAEREG
jgi:chaperone modulatory protein CbpM